MLRYPEILLWLLISCLASASQNRTLKEFDPVLSENPYDTSSAYARSSRRSIILLFCISVVLVLGMYGYQMWARWKSEHAARELDRLKSTDQCLIKILQNFSIKQLEQHRFRGITRKLQTASLGFEGISCSVKGKNGEEVSVLDDITGCFLAGHLSAIMGPSGTGKTTLIDVLTGKKHSDSKWTVGGKVFVNGAEQSIQELKPVTGFVPQEDVVHEGLTVRENLLFSAALRLPRGTSLHRVRKVTEDVLQVLQLEAKQNMIVGNRTLTGEGLSGGQKKRVNVGLELAACPTILFLDEPTSGLDSTASVMLVSQLKRMAELGMTIVMIIHQPRYSLFTQIDDTLLLGLHEGGKCFYMGPTTGAKLHFQNQGLVMPEDENPADWMMDVLCGQIDQRHSRTPKSQLSETLYNAWKNNPEAPGANVHDRGPSNTSTSSQRSNDQDDNDKEIILYQCKDSWTAVLRPKEACDPATFGKVLKECLGFLPGEETIKDIFRRVHTFKERGITQDLEEAFAPVVRGSKRASSWALSSGDTPALADKPQLVTLTEFTKFLMHFRGLSTEALSSRYFRSSSPAQLEEDEESESRSEDDEDESEEDTSDEALRKLDHAEGDLHRIQAGFCIHLRVTTHSASISFWRKLGNKMKFLGVVCFAAAFLGFFDKVIFKNPPWLATTFINAQISLALLVSVYCLQVFSLDQPMYWRESSHGLHRGAFFLGRVLVDTLDWMLMTFFFVLVYYVIVNPVLQFYFYIWPFVLVAYVASGWGYLISTWLPVQYGPFISCLLSFSMGGILGLPMEMGVFLDGGFLEAMVDCISFTRWSAAMSFLCFISKLPPAPAFMTELEEQMLKLYRQNYEQAHFMLQVEESAWWTGILALMIQGSVLRVIAWLGLICTNRDRQI